MARVVFRAEVIESGELDQFPRERLREAVRRLAENPECGKPLARALTGARSIRIGGAEARIVYVHRRATKKGEEDVAEIIAAGPRRAEAVYRTARDRI
jgi:plasmid stabilization system protein ParE